VRFRTPFLALCISVLLAGTSVAQIAGHLNFSGGAGFGMPTGHDGRNLNTGWNLDFRGGYNFSRHLAVDLDYSYNRWNLNSSALAAYGQPGGYTDIWSFSLLPVYHLFPRKKVDFYVLGGPGLYHSNLSLTQPTTATSLFCDPFLGCFPETIGVNQVVASFTTYKGGVSAGGGVEYRLGNSHLKVFSEARYSRMFTTQGSDLEYVPVTFGLRW